MFKGGKDVKTKTLLLYRSSQIYFSNYNYTVTIIATIFSNYI